MTTFEHDDVLFRHLEELVDRGAIAEADLDVLCTRMVGTTSVNLYPSKKKGACTDSAIIVADLKVDRKKLSFDEAFDALIEHVCGICPGVRRVVFVCFGEFSLAKYRRFYSTLEMVRRERHVVVEFYQWNSKRLLKLPH